MDTIGDDDAADDGAPVNDAGCPSACQPDINDNDYEPVPVKLEHRMHHEIPRTEYRREEVETWGLVWYKMEDLWDKMNARDCAYLVK